MVRLAGLTLLISLSALSSALAQDPATRADADRQRREEKAREVRPYEPGGLERAMAFAEDKAIFIVDREGFYPKFGSLTTGSGFAYGIGFRDRDLFENKGSFDIWTAGSTRRYWAAEARLTFPSSWADACCSRRGSAGATIRKRTSTASVPMRIVTIARTTRSVPTSSAGGRASADLVRRSSAAGSSIRRLSVGQRQRRTACRTWKKCSRRRRYRVSATARISSGPTCSSKSTIANQRMRGRADGTASTSPTTTIARPGCTTSTGSTRDVRQFFGFLAGTAGLRRAARGRRRPTPTTVEPMPFYYMPTLGGNDTLRGFREYRFRGPHAILPQAEYRWEIWSGLDAALFYDAGKVADRRADLELRGPREGLRLRLPLQHQQRRHLAGRCRVRKPRRQAPVHRVGRCFLDVRSSVPAAPKPFATSEKACVIACCGGAGRGRRVDRRSASPRFYPDDPVWADDDRALDASKVGEIEDTNGYDFVVNTFGETGERRDVRAMNVNTVDEVPDSSWFTNRIGRRDMTVAEVVQRPGSARRASRSTAGWCPAARDQAFSPASA